MKKYCFYLVHLVSLVIFFSPKMLWAQNNPDNIKIDEKTLGIKELIANQQYAFKAQTVMPLAGRLRQLTSDYDLQVSKDKIVSNLPYFGRAYSAPANLTGGGIEFTSKDFKYLVAETRKNGWNISIQPKDAADVQKMNLTIFSNGTASLQVTSNNRQGISFNGYITALPPVK